jgi:hypothetical protein
MADRISRLKMKVNGLSEVSENGGVSDATISIVGMDRFGESEEIEEIVGPSVSLSREGAGAGGKSEGVGVKSEPLPREIGVKSETLSRETVVKSESLPRDEVGRKSAVDKSVVGSVEKFKESVGSGEKFKENVGSGEKSVDVVEINHVLFGGNSFSEDRAIPEKSRIVKEVVEYVFIANGLSSVNLSFFGDLFDELETEEFTTIDVAGVKFITMKHGTSLMNIYSFVSDLYKGMKDNNRFVCDFVREVSVEGKRAFSLCLSMTDLKAISLCCPEYVFGISGYGSDLSEVRLVVTCQK